MGFDATKSGVRSDINITPLVDVVLVLLIIFMVITPMLQRGKSVELPKAKHAVTRQGAQPAFISVTKVGNVYAEREKRPTKKQEVIEAMPDATAAGTGEETPPEMMNEPPPPDLTQVVFKVDEAGIWHLNSETLTDANAQERLKAYYRVAKSKEATQGPPVIFFDADDKAKYVRAVKALDAIRDSSSGWTIGMMTESIKQEAQQPAAPGAPGAAGGEQQPGATPPPPTPEAPK